MNADIDFLEESDPSDDWDTGNDGTTTKIEIRCVSNGAILKISPDWDKPDEIVYQSSEDAEIEAFRDFLVYLLDHYGPMTGRYSAKRIYITTGPGDKYKNGVESDS